jgi:hypothetical protein
LETGCCAAALRDTKVSRAASGNALTILST